jgi:FdhE protein
LLSATTEAAREPLRFAAALLRAQARLAADIEKMDLTGRLTEDVDQLPHEELLRVAVAAGPPALAAEAEERLADGPAIARTRLLVCWSGDHDDYLSRGVLQPYAETLRARKLAPDRQHTQGKCPFCGGAPWVGALRAHSDADGGLRLLVCSLCALEWNVNRIRCPACFEEDPPKLPVFQSEAHPNVRLETCETCRRYLKSIDLTKDARPIPAVDDLLSLSLDLWAVEEGFTRIEPGLAGL